MCGFLTYVSGSRDAGDRAPAIAGAIECLHHRGPDQTGLRVVDGKAVLAFKRLSIIDVSGSEQPLEYADRYVITFNGEIYNYRQLRDELVRDHGATFATQGDTEVVVAAYHHWGERAVARLRGMFAFVIWDRVADLAFGARDRFGIKPLCYALTEAGAYFASEQKAIAPHVPTTVDGAALSYYLTYQYVPEPYTLGGTIRHLGAGEHFTYTSAGGIRTHRYFRPEFAPVDRPPHEVLADIRDALSDSVAAHMVADVPVGAFLSGGVDSTAVVALARQHNPDLLTFTAALDVEGYSELTEAEESASWLGVKHESVLVTADMMMAALPRIVWHLDDPVADPALVPLYYVAMKASEQVKVVVSGEGADELFAGYPIYREPQSLRMFDPLPDRVRHGVRAVARVIPEGVRGRDFLRRGGTPIEERYIGNAHMFTEAEKRHLMHRYDEAVDYRDITAPRYAETEGLDDVQRMQYIDLSTWLPGDILRKADRMSMAHSLEVRVPFLDPRVFAAAAALPTGLKLPKGTRQTKVALRQALAPMLPPGAADRPKLGFPTPIRVWLRKEMYEWAGQILTASAARELVDLSHGLRLLEAHRRGEGDHSRKVWTLLVFALWYDVFVTSSQGVTPRKHSR